MSTVRRWLRRATGKAHLQWLWQRGSQALIKLDHDAFNQLPHANSLSDVLTLLAAAAYAARQRFGLADPMGVTVSITASA